MTYQGITISLYDKIKWIFNVPFVAQSFFFTTILNHVSNVCIMIRFSLIFKKYAFIPLRDISISKHEVIRVYRKLELILKWKCKMKYNDTSIIRRIFLIQLNTSIVDHSYIKEIVASTSKTFASRGYDNTRNNAFYCIELWE